jgi:hypothetical protein
MNGLLALLFFAASVVNVVLFFGAHDSDKLVIAGLFFVCALNAFGDMREAHEMRPHRALAVNITLTLIGFGGLIAAAVMAVTA